jgi:prepilin-type N-terminal cleavage/methylation domain-containing protein
MPVGRSHEPDRPKETQMKQMFHRIVGRGFTLIELLVVIAIIAILAAVLTPAVTDALTKGKMTGTLSNGRSIYQALFAKDLDDPIFQTGAPYPKSTGGSGHPYYTDSTEYWKWVVTSGVMRVDFSFFSAPGVPPVKSTNVVDFKEGNNAWCISADINDATADAAPVLFTRNLDIQRLDEQNLDTRLTDASPFGKKGLPVITKGGSSFILKLDILTNNFNSIGATNKVLRPMP